MMTKPPKSGRDAATSSESTQHEMQNVSANLPIATTDEAPGQPLNEPDPHSAIHERPTLPITTVQPTADHGPSLQSSAHHSPHHRTFVSTSLLPVAQNPFAPSPAVASPQGHTQPTVLQNDYGLSAALSEEIVAPSDSNTQQAYSQQPHSVTWPPLQNIWQPWIRHTSSTRLVQHSTPPRHTYNVGAQRQIVSAGSPTRRSLDAAGCSQLFVEASRSPTTERNRLPLRNLETPEIMSPRSQSNGATSPSTIPRERYPHDRNVPYRSSSQSPASPPLSTYDQFADDLRSLRLVPIDREQSNDDSVESGRTTRRAERRSTAHVIRPSKMAQAARRTYASRERTPRLTRNSQFRAVRGRGASGNDTSGMNVSSASDQRSSPSSIYSHPEWERTHRARVDVPGPQEIPRADQQDALLAAMAQLARTSPQLMQLLTGLGRTWQAMQEAWPSVQRVFASVQELRQPLDVIVNVISEVQRMHTSSANDEPVNIPRNSTPQHVPQDPQPSRSDGNIAVLPQNATPPERISHIDNESYAAAATSPATEMLTWKPVSQTTVEAEFEECTEATTVLRTSTQNKE